MSKRLPELDLLRTIAILGMITYHAAYDLGILYGWDVPVFEGGWLLLARATASLFLLLVGIGFAISASRKETIVHLWKRQHNRFWMLAGSATLVSIATYLADPETFVRFGILHLIALSMLILPLIRFLKEWTVFIGAAIAIAGQWTVQTPTLQPLSMILGFAPIGFMTVDYFPFLPWLGVILIGYGLGYLLYVRLTGWRPVLFDRIPTTITWPGRHSLMIYLVHQPALLAILHFMH